MPDFCEAVAAGEGGVGIITHDTLKGPDLAMLVDCLRRQPSWSELPLLVIAPHGALPARAVPRILSDLRALRAAVVLPRPLRIAMLASAVQMALRERRRQYEQRSAAEREDLLRRLQAEHEWLEFAQSAGNIGVFEFFLDEDRATLSPQLESILGLKPGSFDGKRESFWTFLDPQDAPHARAEVMRMVQERGAFDIEFRIVRPDGSVRWINSRGRLAKGDPRRITGVKIDITARKAAEQALRDAQKLESIVTLASGVAHDFNNLLTGIMGNASLGEDMLPPDHVVRPILERIVSATQSAAGLTRQLLAYAGKGRIVVEKVDLSALISATSGLIRSALPKTVDLRLNLAGGLSLIEADRSQIEQILMNLVINAGEAIGADPAGVVEIKTMKHEDGTPAVCLEVKDNGPGISEQVKARIFDPFFSTKFLGRGLGLAAVAGIVRSYNGEISVYSEPGQGATFHICLPATAESAGVTVVQRPAIPRFAGTGFVLVVDDEESVREMLRAALEKYGFSVLLARDGREALAIYDRHARDITLVVLDLIMPVMGGELTLEELHARNPELPILISTADPEADIKRLSGLHSRLDLLRKPFDVGQLTARLAPLLEERIKERRAGERDP